LARRTDGTETDEMWTMDNTEGFTQAQLDTINAVLDRIMKAGGEGLEPHSINDAINNEWREGLTEEDLYEATAKRLGIE